MKRFTERIVAASPEIVRVLWMRMESSSLGSRLVRGTFWMVMGAVISRLLGLLGSIILARILGKVSFGEFGIIQSTVGVFGTFAGMGIGLAATKHVAEYRVSQPIRCGRVIGFSLGVAVVGGILASLALGFFSDWLAIHTLAAPHLATLLRTGVGLVIFGALQGAYLGALSGFEAFRQASWVNWGSSLIGIPLLVAGTLMWKLEGAVWAMILQTALSCALGHWALKKETAKTGIKIAYDFSREEWQLLLRFALPVFISTLLATQAGWVSRTMLVNEPDGYAETALVNAANQWMNLIVFLPGTMGSVLVPIFTSLYTTGQRKKLIKLFRHSVLLNVGVGLLLAGPLILSSSGILSLYGAGFKEGKNIFILAMLCGVLVTANNLFSRMLQSAGQAWFDLASNAFWAAAVILGSWPLVHHYKGFGNVAAHTIAAIVLLIWQGWMVQRLLATTGDQVVKNG